MHSIDPSIIPQGPVAYTVRLDTTSGVIDIIVRPDWAPHGARRFLELAAAGDLDGLAFYRAVKGCLAQFGLPAKRSWPALPDDPATGVPFLLGAVCFAAVGSNSRKSTLFICIGDMSHCFGQSPWETPIGAVAEASLDVLDNIETIYGDIAECGGAGPNTGRIAAEGTDYLRADFPLLTYIHSARPLDWPPGCEGAAATQPVLEPSTPRPAVLQEQSPTPTAAMTPQVTVPRQQMVNAMAQLPPQPVPLQVSQPGSVSAKTTIEIPVEVMRQPEPQPARSRMPTAREPAVEAAVARARWPHSRRQTIGGPTMQRQCTVSSRVSSYRLPNERVRSSSVGGIQNQRPHGIEGLPTPQQNSLSMVSGIQPLMAPRSTSFSYDRQQASQTPMRPHIVEPSAVVHMQARHCPTMDLPTPQNGSFLHDPWPPADGSTFAFGASGPRLSGSLRVEPARAADGWRSPVTPFQSRPPTLGPSVNLVSPLLQPAPPVLHPGPPSLHPGPQLQPGPLLQVGPPQLQSPVQLSLPLQQPQLPLNAPSPQYPIHHGLRPPGPLNVWQALGPQLA